MARESFVQTKKLIYPLFVEEGKNIKQEIEAIRHMLNKGNYIAPSQYEAIFISAAHTENDINKTLDDIQKFFNSIKN